MNKIVFLRNLLLLLVCGIIDVHAQDINFNDSWKFFNAEAEGAEQVTFNDSKWRKLELPHDWAIEGLLILNTMHVPVDYLLQELDGTVKTSKCKKKHKGKWFELNLKVLCMMPMFG